MRPSRRLLPFLSAAALAGTSLPAAALPLPLDLPLDDRLVPASGEVSPAVAGEELVGTFLVAAGECGGDTPSGSYFRMVQGGGTPEDGPYVANTDSPCDDNTATPLTPGSDGGLSTVGFQPHPDPAFDGAGNGLADRIVEPARFFGSGFALASEDPDPQSGTSTTVPTITHDGGGALGGDLRALAVAWNGAYYHQGAPKADGSTPGQTTDGPSGTYDPATGAFTLEWVSTIEGGAFNGFSGFWHLEGTFEADGGAPADDVSDDTGTDDDATDTGDDASVADETDVAGDETEASPGDEQTLADTGPSLPTVVGMALLFAAVMLWLRDRRMPA